jgi:hypothetical protein
MVSIYKKLPTNIAAAKSEKLFAFFAALLSWTAISIQAYLFYSYRTSSTGEMVIRFFSFFTVLSNILVAIVYTMRLVRINNPLVNFFQKAATFYAVTVYILMVGIVYNTVLRGLWHPIGLQKWVAEVLHAVIPLFFFIYWLLFVAPVPVRWKNSFYWLVFPLIYFLIILIRGKFADYYPYPFFDVKKIGLQKALVNGLVLVICFWVISIFLITAGKLTQRYNKRKQL